MRGFILAAALAVGATTALAQTAPSEAELKRGAYLAMIMDCHGCHADRGPDGKILAGRDYAGSKVGFQFPGFGYVWPPNLTGDRETGLGRWSEQQIVRALRTGQSRSGRMLAPIMPWEAYAKLTDEDAFTLARYLKTLPAVSHKVPDPVAPDGKPTAPYRTMVVPGK
jgi:mono/diheme cytochrome c family protein